MAQHPSWQTRLGQLAAKAIGKASADQLIQCYQTLFSSEYQILVSPRYALQDLLHLQKLGGADAQSVSLLRPCQGVEHFRLHFYSQQERFLDEYIPLLENLNLRVMDQVQFRLFADDKLFFIKSFTIHAAKIPHEDFPRLRSRILATLQAVMDGKIENDPLNKLCVLAGLPWQDIDLLRAYRNYFLQLDHHTSRISVHHALTGHAEVAKGLCLYFDARFRPNPEWQDPMRREEQALFPLRLQLLDSLKSVTDMNADRILRTLFNLIDATMRSNFHVRRDVDDYFISFKINSLGVIDMPMPKPQAEIYVHAVDMEGIHLRGGKISRGGIRWSDRPDDFRTEILGLMQTQISKNALIIPTGAKGGFVVKKNGGKLDFRAAGKQAYLKLMHGLLDLTDNWVDGHIVAPPNLVVYDDPDPYLVVAADKGTAAFSDIANGVADEYQFWLGDAFASGGSHGYDHKALGITARGAWECVKRHFREIGTDIQNQAFTVVGIGSMDGDVFGNGMMLSPHIRLLAAFSGQHIFIDPNPPADDRAINERKRLFNLAGSSWNDYGRSLISAGGGVYARSDKDIPISAELKEWLGLRYKTLDGEALIRALLAAPADLLWLGGIGTYVKASSEKHEEVGDRSNDNVRINAAELQAKIVGEGANLGFTQKARIEFALRGGRINTDAVDNSAGVDTSDHEVNLKILLKGLQKRNLINDYQALFTDMTDAVCQLVLANNIAQSLCLSLEQCRSEGQAEAYLHLAEHLEAAGFLDKAVESFPPNKAILTRPTQTLTRSEFAVLLAASKRYLTSQIQHQAELLHDDCCGCYLQAYFPAQIVGQYQTHLSSHPLAKEIKATMISNKIINQAGCGFLNLAAETDNVLDAVSCYLSFDRIFDGDTLRAAIAALDNQLSAGSQYFCCLQLENTLLTACQWTLAHGQPLRPDAGTLAQYRSYFEDYRGYVKQNSSLLYMTQCQEHQQAGVPLGLAEDLAVLACMDDFAFMVALAGNTQKIATSLALYHELSEFLGIDAVLARLAKVPLHTVWEHTVARDLQADIKQTTGKMIKQMLVSRIYQCADYFTMTAGNPSLANYRRVYQEVNNTPLADLLPFVVLGKALAKLV
ncbi:NAD-glutamate dehydrogenase domain-containing protein [Methylovulum sp.]|uniref:NAD-glutamate dehydrogenase domain-containing protein n=1 Tax=Methylovulum sp. TaxID=1916980 RepID=UPI002607761B|nr:NAD-glutamate dehydrogenase domain-containing protein [Methylovulum sp.]MDD5125634.1 NAD-glutamate dehydrogenase [Methylovulum sp.]